jgi:ABC-2 type transport system ATP-binding protein
MTAAVHARQLVRAFGKADALTAVDRLDLQLPMGGVTGLVGPDGAGKTTLMRMMAGLLAPTSGELRVVGLDPIGEGDALRAVTGYMPQKFGLYEDLTVQENLNLYADLRGVTGTARDDAFSRMLDFTDLRRFTGRPAGKLSGGMKQKLGLACALLGQPRLLLLDEPSVGVDPISRRELWRMVRALAGDGMTVIWATAYLDEAERCDQVVLLDQGRALFKGAPAELAEQMAGRTWLVRDVGDGKREVLRRAMDMDRVRDGVVQGRSVRLVATSAEALGPADLDLPADVRIEPTPPRLEDGFVDLLGGAPKGGSVVARLLEAPARADRPEAVIEAEHLTKRFGDFAATDDVTFQVRQGEIFGLLGPNGAGKSTTFKMMCGLLAPTAGEARVLGLSLSRSPEAARQKLGYMAQKFSLYGALTVRQNLEFFAGIYGLAGARRRERVAAMIDAFALAPYLGVSPDALPLGFKQRLALACAIMHDPAILFLDEPTSGVDPITRREFWSHINGVVAKGVTVMVTTHFMDEAEYCDRIGLIYRGRLIALGAPDDLRREAASADDADPDMEEAFITLVQRSDAAREAVAA